MEFYGTIFYSGRKIYNKTLCIMPALFILIETTILLMSVFIKKMKLYSAITDLICLIYNIFDEMCI